MITKPHVVISSPSRIIGCYTLAHTGRVQQLSIHFPVYKPTATMSGIKVVFGGAGLNKDRPLGDVATLKSAFDLLEQNGVTTIDTANLYGDSETILGDAGAPGRFTIDTKTRGGFNKEGGGARDAIVEEAANSRGKLGTVDIFYIHAPDGNTPLKDTLAAINEVHKTGFFKRFGLSNYKVQTAH